MFRLAHISDIHLGPMPPVRFSQLLSKRITGYLNWHRNRAKHFSPMTLNRLAADMLAQSPDHMALTGDLVNIGLDAEIARATRWLETLGKGYDLSVVCGNHDAYVRGSLANAFTQWQDYVGGDKDEAVTIASYPMLRHRGPCAIILANSAVPTAPFKATGYFDVFQAERLTKMLADNRDRCRVVLIHHPPFENATTASKRLIGDGLFREVIENSGAELILHGHTHLDTIRTISGPRDVQVPVICVPAGGQEEGGRKPAAAYNLFDIDLKKSAWHIQMRQNGYRNGTITTLHEQEFVLPDTH